MSQPLRKCRECGLEAYTQEELELFVKHKNYLYGYVSWCKKCRNEYDKQRHELNPLLGRYRNMIRRCYSPNHNEYLRYGGRGITVCEEWRNDRQAFVDWAKINGFKTELTLERVDNDASYSPENCRYATAKEQARNRRDNVTNFEKETRICSVCKIEKSLTEFYKNKNIPLSYQYICKDCHKENQKRRRREKSSSRRLHR